MQYDKLKNSKSFVQLRRNGSDFVAPAFVILVQKTHSDKSNPLKIGFTTSKKLGNAIKRVRARRRLKAALNHVDPKIFSQFNGLEFNIIARHKSLSADLEKVVFYFNKTLEKINHEISKKS